MLFFRYYLLAICLLLLFWWPINFIRKYFIYKRRVKRVTNNMKAVYDFPFIGNAWRYFGKNNEGLTNKLKFIFKIDKMKKIIEILFFYFL